MRQNCLLTPRTTKSLFLGIRRVAKARPQPFVYTLHLGVRLGVVNGKSQMEKTEARLSPSISLNRKSICVVGGVGGTSRCKNPSSEPFRKGENAIYGLLYGDKATASAVFQQPPSTNESHSRSLHPEIELAKAFKMNETVDIELADREEAQLGRCRSLVQPRVEISLTGRATVRVPLLSPAGPEK